MPRERLGYLTHVDWRHVRQRPHHFACGLASRFDVTVVSPIARRQALHVTNPANGLRHVRLLRMPGSYRSAAIFAANNTLCSLELRARLAPPDIVMATAPECYAWVESRVARAFVVYDCMDDALAFDQDDDVRRAKASLERTLLARADLVVASSEVLRDRCVERGGEPGRTMVVPNGWDPSAFPVAPSQPLPRRGRLKLTYFGTLDRWLDVAALEALVAALPLVTVELIGPNSGGLSGLHDRIRIRPPVPHERLADAVAASDALILPFQVTDLIRAVDPVKLYEYVALGKPIVSAYWPALERFAPFLTFYQSAGELVRIVEERSIAAPPDAAMRATFLAGCSWESRVEEVLRAIAGKRRR